jgi:hypothetical protein
MTSGKQSTLTQVKTNWVDLGFKLLSLLFLPLLGVGLSMWNEQAVIRERITNMQREQTEVSTQLDAAKARLDQITLTVQDTNGQIRELRTILEFIRTQVASQGATQGANQATTHTVRGHQ